MALGKELFKKNKKLCRVPPIRHSAKNFFKNKIKNFAESHPSGARQRNLKKTLPSAIPGGARQRILKKNKNKKLCRVPARAALGKEFKKNEKLCRVPSGLALGKAAVTVSCAVTARFLCRVLSIFFRCHLAKLVWCIFKEIFSLDSYPNSLDDFCSSWQRGKGAFPARLILFIFAGFTWV